MGGVAAAAENRGPVKKRKNSLSVKLKASDYVGLPNKRMYAVSVCTVDGAGEKMAAGGE